MSPEVAALVAWGVVVTFGGLCFLACWLYDRRQQTRCRRGWHDWGYWHVGLRGTPTVLGPMDLFVSHCQRGCGAHVRRMTGIGYGEGEEPGLAERLFREARS